MSEDRLQATLNPFALLVSPSHDSNAASDAGSAPPKPSDMLSPKPSSTAAVQPEEEPAATDASLLNDYLESVFLFTTISKRPSSKIGSRPEVCLLLEQEPSLLDFSAVEVLLFDRLLMAEDQISV
jgi:hypothetical protein